MKLRSAPLDDVFQELLLTLDEDGRLSARIVRRMVIAAYRALKRLMLLIRRLPWQSRYPEFGNEPFNLSDAELEKEWRSK